jgi:hypothetical protein
VTRLSGARGFAPDRASGARGFAPDRGLVGAVAAALALAAVGVLSASCASVIDANGYEDVATTLCACAQVRFDSCENHVRTALTAASDPAVETWLANFDRRGCDESCKNAARCIDADPVCADEGRSCIHSEECCGWSSAGGAFCYDSKCVRDEPDCRHTGDLCTTSDECCGFIPASNRSTCRAAVEDSRCFETCDPGNPVNCPGCCLVPTNSLAAICFETEDFPCERFCNPDGPEPRCPDGGCCLEECDPESAVCFNLCGPCP